MKEKIEGVFDGVTVYDSEIAFRLRGTRGNANVTIINTEIHDCQKAIRAEDTLSNLKVYHSTFWRCHCYRLPDCCRRWQSYLHTWGIRNNVFMGAKPQAVSNSSNKAATCTDFAEHDH